MDTAPNAPHRKAPPALLWSLLVVAVVVAGLAVAMMVRDGDTQDANTSNRTLNSNAAPSETPYSNADLGITLTLADGWAPLAGSTFKGDVVFQSPRAIGCGCIVYVTREANPAGATINDWLADPGVKKDTYISQAEYDRRRASSDPSIRALAGTYTESESQLAGLPAIRQEYQSEGGGYGRYLIPRDSSVYAVTLWSDAYYFTDSTRRTSFDNGRLMNEVDTLLGSLVIR